MKFRVFTNDVGPDQYSALRDIVAPNLEGLKDPDKPMDIARAKAISEIAQTIINTAKVEVELVKAVGGSGTGTGFLQLPEESRELPKLGAPKNRGPLQLTEGKRAG